METRGDDDLHLVLAARDGDPDAFGALFDRWFDRVFDVSFRILRDRDLAAEVAQDVFLVAWRQLSTLRQPGSFGGWLLRMSRNRSLNRLEKERRSVALGDEETGTVIDRRSPAPDASAPVERGEHVDLVWAAAQALGERDASVLDLHLRHGLGPSEIAEELGVTTNNAHQILFRLKDRLAGAIGGWVLWSDGSPSCPQLAGALGSAGIERFGADAVAAIGRHAEGCADCEERRRLRLSPEAMFAAVPVAVAGPFLRAEAAAALAADGVPMGGSSSLGGIGHGGPATEQTSLEDAAGLDGPADGSEDRHAVRSRARALMGIVAVVVVAAAVVAVADSVGDGTDVVSAPIDAVVTTTVAGSTSTGSSATTGTTVAPPTTVAPRPTPTPTTVAPTTDPAVPTPPTPPDPDPSTGSTSSTRPLPVPSVADFSATLVRVTERCPTASGFRHLVRLDWSTADAESVSIAGPGVTPGTHPPTGSTIACAPLDSVVTYVLAARGPGGTASASREVATLSPES